MKIIVKFIVDSQQEQFMLEIMQIPFMEV